MALAASASRAQEATPAIGRYEFIGGPQGQLVKFDTATGEIWTGPTDKAWIEMGSPVKLGKEVKLAPGRFRLTLWKDKRDEIRWLLWDSADGRAWRSATLTVPEKDGWRAFPDK
jgi:hypothetical protein